MPILKRDGRHADLHIIPCLCVQLVFHFDANFLVIVNAAGSPGFTGGAGRTPGDANHGLVTCNGFYNAFFLDHSISRIVFVGHRNTAEGKEQGLPEPC